MKCTYGLAHNHIYTIHDDVSNSGKLVVFITSWNRRSSKVKVVAMEIPFRFLIPAKTIRNSGSHNKVFSVSYQVSCQHIWPPYSVTHEASSRTKLSYSPNHTRLPCSCNREDPYSDTILQTRVYQSSILSQTMLDNHSHLLSSLTRAPISPSYSPIILKYHTELLINHTCMSNAVS